MKMCAFSLRSLAYAMLIAILIWSSQVDICSARRGKHWRQNKASLASLYKKKAKNHGNNSHNHNSSKQKHKSTPPPPPLSSVPVPPPCPSPLPTPPPAPTPPPPSEPKPKGSPPPPAPTPPPPPPPSTQVKPPPPPKKDNDTIFNVLDFGAKGDGSSDDTKAFQAAWASACKAEASTMMVPSEYTFLVGPISFSGPYCQANIVFQLDGTIIAPTSAKAWGSGLLQWLEFSKLKGISIQGTGIIDGRGSVWWQKSFYDDPFDSESKLAIPLTNTTRETPPLPIRDSLGGKMPSIKPTALRFYGSFNVTVTGITIQNSPQCHLKFDFCTGVFVYNMDISSPGDSPNTDGIHLQMSKDVLIRSSNLSCGDDCISIQTGCTNVFVRNVNCGPGHGISIGGLGKEGTKACVANVTVRDVTMHNTTNGVRIKTWQGGSGSVQGVLFSNIQVSEVQFPIVIDQYYCDKSTCKNQTSAVALSGITYERIRGTYTIKPVHLACSDSLPCVDVTLTDIELKPQQEKYHMYDPFCWESYGELNSPTQPPIDCIRSGKPSRNRIFSDENLC